MATSIQIYLKARIDRNRELRPEAGRPGTLLEVQDISPNETIETLKIEIETKISDWKSEIIDTLRKDMVKGEEKVSAIESKLESLQHKCNEDFSMM